MPNLNRIGLIEPELWQKIIGVLEEERISTPIFGQVKKITTFEAKKNTTCRFHLRIEEGETYSEKNKSGLWVTRKLFDLDSENGAFDDSYYTSSAESA